MDGAEFLAKVREVSPTTVRMMLTGCNDQRTAIEAVNTGQIFQFLNKPCPPDAFAGALKAGLEQHRLIVAEKELLEKTLKGCVKVLTDILALVNPIAFGRASRVRRIVRQIATQLNSSRVWELEIAAMLSQVGCVTVPGAVLEKVYSGSEISSEECQMLEKHPAIGGDLIGQIPRLGGIARIIANQSASMSDAADPEAKALPMGARILKVALDYDTLAEGGLEPWEAIGRIDRESAQYDPRVLEALSRVVAAETKCEQRSVNIQDLMPGMILVQDVVTDEGVLVIAKGQEVTDSLKARLTNFAQMGHVSEPIRIMIPW
jgi:response regulator RpfG family c-di-GMP phosphodiesterase